MDGARARPARTKNACLYRSAHPGRQQRFESRSRRRIRGRDSSDPSCCPEPEAVGQTPADPVDQQMPWRHNPASGAN